jgi:hypothetical protein
MSQITIDVADRAHLDQVLIGLAAAEELAGVDGDVYLDEEGTPIAHREAGRVVANGAVKWQRPSDVASSAAVVVATAGRVPSRCRPAPCCCCRRREFGSTMPGTRHGRGNGRRPRPRWWPSR